jgi:hypothetical protein
MLLFASGAGLYMISVIAMGVRRLEGPAGSTSGSEVATVAPETVPKSRNCAVLVVTGLPLVTLALTAMPT